MRSSSSLSNLFFYQWRISFRTAHSGSTTSIYIIIWSVSIDCSDLLDPLLQIAVIQAVAKHPRIRKVIPILCCASIAVLILRWYVETMLSDSLLKHFFKIAQMASRTFRGILLLNFFPNFRYHVISLVFHQIMRTDNHVIDSFSGSGASRALFVAFNSHYLIHTFHVICSDLPCTLCLVKMTV